MWDTVFDKIGLNFHFLKIALNWIEMWDAIFDRIGLNFHLIKRDANFGFDFCQRIVPGKFDRNP